MDRIESRGIPMMIDLKVERWPIKTAEWNVWKQNQNVSGRMIGGTEECLEIKFLFQTE